MGCWATPSALLHPLAVASVPMMQGRERRMTAAQRHCAPHSIIAATTNKIQQQKPAEDDNAAAEQEEKSEEAK